MNPAQPLLRRRLATATAGPAVEGLGVDTEVPRPRYEVEDGPEIKVLIIGAGNSEHSSTFCVCMSAESSLVNFGSDEGVRPTALMDWIGKRAALT